MTPRDLFVRLGGHDPITMGNEGREATQPITMAGSTVLIAALVTSMNWAVAAHTLAGGGTNTRSLIAAAAGTALGFLLVTVIDRAGIYQMDTQSDRWFRKLMLILIRLTIVLLVGAVTAGAIAPVVLGPELEAHALKMREQAELGRLRSMRERYSVATLSGAAGETSRELAEARAAVATIPPDILARQATARACWRGLAAARARLSRQGTPEPETRRLLAGHAARCAAEDDGARRELRTHGERTRAALAEAERRHAAAGASLDHAEGAVEDRLAEANTIEARAISVLSSTVLGSLLASDTGARMKWYGIYAFITCLELLPLILKLLSDRSAPGVRIAADRAITVAAHERRRAAALEDQQREAALRAAMAEAMDAALDSAEVRDQAIRQFQSKAEALLPVEIAKQLFAEIESGAREAEAAIRRHPDHARVISEAWARAIDDISSRLRSGPGAAPA